jgi:hypothetical protein
LLFRLSYRWFDCLTCESFFRSREGVAAIGSGLEVVSLLELFLNFFFLAEFLARLEAFGRAGLVGDRLGIEPHFNNGTLLK